MRSGNVRVATDGVIENNYLDTPMRRLIRKYPDVAEAVLDKCFKERYEDGKYQVGESWGWFLKIISVGIPTYAGMKTGF